MKQTGQQLSCGQVARGAHENDHLGMLRTYTSQNFSHYVIPSV
jgi:hypothetical protein